MITLRHLILVFCLLFFAGTSHSMTWSDFWWRKDQQAMSLFNKGKHEAAAKLFKSPAWSGVANYRSKNYAAAEKKFSQQQDALSHYNLGNALALQGKFEEAIKAYNRAIKQQPHFKDAIYNRDLIQKLLQQKNPENHSNSSSKKDEQQKDKSQDSQDQSSNKDDSKNQNSDKQNSKDQNSSSQPSNQKNDSDNKNSKEKDPSSPEQKNGKPGEKEKEKSPSPSQQDHSQQSNPSSQNSQSIPSGGKNQERSQLMKGMSAKEDQETDQWLQQIPDEPEGLLRRKIMRDHLKKKNES